MTICIYVYILFFFLETSSVVNDFIISISTSRYNMHRQEISFNFYLIKSLRLKCTSISLLIRINVQVNKQCKRLNSQRKSLRVKRMLHICNKTSDILATHQDNLTCSFNRQRWQDPFLLRHRSRIFTLSISSLLGRIFRTSTGIWIYHALLLVTSWNKHIK